MKILIVEDNAHLATDIREFLEEQGFRVELAATLRTAEEKVNIYRYDLVVIDLGLPDGSGMTLIQILKDIDANTGILIVTARNTIEDKVKGLELGADDYITKPFHKAELNARIRSILRRGKFDGSNSVSFREISIDTLSNHVTVKDAELELTKKEYELLLYFMYNKNRMLTKESIAEHLWGDYIDQSDSFDFIYNHIKNLRKKIKKAGGNDYIHSMYGMGYKFSAGKN